MNEPHESDPSNRLVEIIERVAESDECALEKLYDLTNRLIFAFILRIVCNVALAEEVTLDTYLQVWRQARRYDDKRANPTTWLFMIARTRAIDAVRASKRHEAEPLDDTGLIGALESPEEALLTEAWQLKLHSAMTCLRPVQREAIEMAFFLDMTHREIAAKLGKPLGTVKSHIRVGMLRLREHFEPKVTRSPSQKQIPDRDKLGLAFASILRVDCDF